MAWRLCYQPGFQLAGFRFQLVFSRMSCHTNVLRYNSFPVDDYIYIYIYIYIIIPLPSLCICLFVCLSLTLHRYHQWFLAGHPDCIQCQHRLLMYVSLYWSANTGSSMCRSPRKKSVQVLSLFHQYRPACFVRLSRVVYAMEDKRT